jgi:hypothetical protein
MATATQLKHVSKAITDIAVAVSNTFVDQAKAIADAGFEAFKGNAPTKEEVTTVVNTVTESASWKGSKSEAARQSEVRSIVNAYQYIGKAAPVFKREYGELRREHFVKLARMCPAYETPTDAALDTVTFFEKRDSKTGGKKAKPADKLRANMVGAVNAATDAGNASLAQSLRNLAKKHGIKLS